MMLIDRDEAARRNQSWYFTGKPCKWGHVSKRNTCNYSCRECCKRQNTKGVDREELEKRKHQQWLADYRRRRTERLAEQRRKQELDLAAKLLS